MVLMLAAALALQEVDAPMRWRFAAAPGAAEPERKTVSDRMDAWWREFAKRHADIAAFFAGKSTMDLPAWMQQHLQAIHPALMWEYGPALKRNGDRLVITPESRYALRPLVEEILKRAPALPGWEFYGHRPAVAPPEALGLAEGRTGRKPALTTAAAARGTFNRIDLTFTSPAVKTEEDVEAAFHEAFILAESLLGEDVLDTWVGVVRVAPWKAAPAGAVAHKDLRREVDRLVAAVRDALPKDPVHRFSQAGKWSLLKLKPDEQADYPAQDDLFVAKAMNVKLWENGRSRAFFSSSRWSRTGETFCYVKLDGRKADQEAFPDKAAIEDALEAALRKANLGCHVGGGTGKIYSYVDLAVTDLEKAVPVIRETLQKGKVDRRSWILFYDSTLAWEWIGVWDDSPPPPRSKVP